MATRRDQLQAQRYSFGNCSRCGRSVTLDDQGMIRPHAKNPDMGAGSRKCPGGGKAPSLVAKPRAI